MPGRGHSAMAREMGLTTRCRRDRLSGSLTVWSYILLVR
jgi:hypothetical protein